MKSEQFKHNLAKHKRQQQHKREQDQNVEQLRNLFQDFGKIYSNNK